MHLSLETEENRKFPCQSPVIRVNINDRIVLTFKYHVQRLWQQCMLSDFFLVYMRLKALMYRLQENK